MIDSWDALEDRLGKAGVLENHLDMLLDSCMDAEDEGRDVVAEALRVVDNEMARLKQTREVLQQVQNEQ